MNRRKCFSRKFGSFSAINLVGLVLAYALLGNSLLDARVGSSATGGSPQEQTTSKPTVQQRILAVPNGTMIEVRLLNKQKLRGRLGEITSEGFSLQTAQGSAIETQKVAFTDVKSLKQLENTTGKKVGTGLLFALAGIGVFTVIIIAVCASGACGG
jgi:hypothetical protein